MAPQQNQVQPNSLSSLAKIIIFLYLTLFQIRSENNDSSATSIISYKVNTTVKSRFSKTHISINFNNNQNCTMLYGYEMQIPQNAKVTNLTMKSSNQDCTINSEVKEEKEAQLQFDTSLSQGKPAALLKAWNSTLYPIQVSIPAHGNTIVDVVYEEILFKKKHEIKFQVPFFPGVYVNNLLLDVLVDEPYGGVNKFNISETGLSSMKTYSDDKTATAHLELSNVSNNINDGNGNVSLPRMIDVSYKPGFLPENGILFPDHKKECITHLFNPESLLNVGPMPRNIIFVIDVSGSMQGQKLDDAKAAYASIIETLTDNDYFTMHTFSNEGIESSWGPEKATDVNKGLAAQFVKELFTIGSTNLHDAYIKGIEKLIDVQSNTIGSSQANEYIPIMLMLTDGQATTGETYSKEIVKAVKKANEEHNVKIYALAFGSDADLNLLRGISLMNNGIAIPIYEGFNDASTQMEDFFIGELGSIRLSDISVSLGIFGGSNINYDIPTTTKSSFPVLSDGSEIVVRARLNNTNIIDNLFSDMDEKSSSGRMIQAITKGKTKQGDRTWITQLDIMNDDNKQSSYYNNECIHSFAHDKIKELLEFRDVVEYLGADQLMDYAPFDTSKNDDDLASMSKSEALALALEAGLVWPGLTSMVTNENECLSGLMDNSTSAPPICPNDGVALDQDKNYISIVENSAADIAFASPVYAQTQAYPVAAISATKSAGGSNMVFVPAPPPPPPSMSINSYPTYSPVSSPISTMAPTSSTTDFLNETIDLNDTSRLLLFLNDVGEEEKLTLISSDTNEKDNTLEDSIVNARTHPNVRSLKSYEYDENYSMSTATLKEQMNSFIVIISCAFAVTAALFFTMFKLLYVN